MSGLLEVCVASVASARAAQAGGAQRLELCQNLEQGGTTPSYGLIRQVLAAVQLPVMVLIRPRAGDFVYDADERAAMLADVQLCRELGCAGVAVGALTANGTIDVPQCRTLVEAAGPLSVTFHRAFDACPHLAQALEDVVALGCHRMLTSGGQASAELGQAQLAALVRQAGGRLSIMPGAGITPANVAGLAAATGAREFHASAKQLLPPLPTSGPTEFAAPRWETSPALVEQLVAQLRR